MFVIIANDSVHESGVHQSARDAELTIAELIEEGAFTADDLEVHELKLRNFNVKIVVTIDTSSY